MLRARFWLVQAWSYLHPWAYSGAVNEVRLVSVTCLNDKYTYKTTALSLQQASAQFSILMFFIHFFLLIQSVLICYCNHTAKVSVLTPRRWKTLFPDCFSAAVFQCCGLRQGWWRGEARSRRPPGKREEGMCFPVVQTQKHELSMFSLGFSW